jgi:hypothetical protein
MKVAGIACYYVNDLDSLVAVTDRITKITHATIDARLAAVLTALRYWQALGLMAGGPRELLAGFVRAIEILQFGDEADFFLSRTRIAAQLAEIHSDPSDLLIALSRNIGITHLAWSTPISACFWSYRSDNDFEKWFALSVEDRIQMIPRKSLEGVLTLDECLVVANNQEYSVQEEDEAHLRQIGALEEFLDTHGYHWRKTIDLDTFYSLAFSTIAAEQGVSIPKADVAEAIAAFNYQIVDVYEGLRHHFDRRRPTALSTNWGAMVSK